MARRLCILGCLFLVSTFFICQALPGDNQSKPPPAEEVNFNGKVLFVLVPDPDKGHVVTPIQDVKVRRLGGRAFLVGTYVKIEDSDTTPQAVWWLPVGSVVSITEFKSLEDARKARAYFMGK